MATNQHNTRSASATAIYDSSNLRVHRTKKLSKSTFTMWCVKASVKVQCELSANAKTSDAIYSALIPTHSACAFLTHDLGVDIGMHQLSFQYC